jgi:hypothetical protein
MSQTSFSTILSNAENINAGDEGEKRFVSFSQLKTEK